MSQKQFRNKSMKYGYNYGDYGLPYRGMVNSYTNGLARGSHKLSFPNSKYLITNQIDLSSVPVNYHSFGNTWYKNIDLDNHYSVYNGGYSYPNAGMGPYLATGLGNYPAKMYAEKNSIPTIINSFKSANSYGKRKHKRLFDEVKNNIRRGGLRKSLKVSKDFKFTKSKIASLLKHKVGKTFQFQKKHFTMTKKLKKQLQLALNMMK